MKSGLIKKVRGISVANPVDVEKNYLMETVDYAIKNGYNRFQFIGPIHNPVKGNVDGITLYEKYARFNKDKDLSYARLNIDLLNRACERLAARKPHASESSAFRAIRRSSIQSEFYDGKTI